MSPTSLPQPAAVPGVNNLADSKSGANPLAMDKIQNEENADVSTPSGKATGKRTVPADAVTYTSDRSSKRHKAHPSLDVPNNHCCCCTAVQGLTTVISSAINKHPQQPSTRFEAILNLSYNMNGTLRDIKVKLGSAPGESAESVLVSPGLGSGPSDCGDWSEYEV